MKPTLPEPPDLSGRLVDRARLQIIDENRKLAARVRELENELAAERTKLSSARKALSDIASSSVAAPVCAIARAALSDR